MNVEKKSSIIHGEPEAQLVAEEDGTGRSKPVRRKKPFGAVAWSFTGITNVRQAEGLTPENIPHNCHHISSTAATATWHCTAPE